VGSGIGVSNELTQAGLDKPRIRWQGNAWTEGVECAGLLGLKTGGGVGGGWKIQDQRFSEILEDARKEWERWNRHGAYSHKGKTGRSKEAYICDEQRRVFPWPGIGAPITPYPGFFSSVKHVYYKANM